MKLKDKVAIITGGGQGIGKEYALGFAREGAKVVIAEIKLENAQQVVKEIESQGGKAIAVRTDVTSEADARQVAEKTIATFGRIDALVNNAAIYYGLEMKPFEFISEKEWDAMMAVNVKGLFIMSKAVMPQMKKQKSGSIQYQLWHLVVWDTLSPALCNFEGGCSGIFASNGAGDRRAWHPGKCDLPRFYH